MAVEIRKAATVLVVRDAPAAPEVFMVRRHGRAVFMGGAHVFPGGAVDANDEATADAQFSEGGDQAAAGFPDLRRSEALALHVAAIRELFEEAGVLLARKPSGQFVSMADAGEHHRFVQHRQDVHAGHRPLAAILAAEQLRLALDALVPCAHWVTPPLDTRRFDTRFFLARLPHDQQPIHDERETTESRWITAAAAIAAAQRREIVLPTPTWAMLREIESFRSVEEALEWARTRLIRRREPRLVVEGNERTLILPGDKSYPDDSGETPRFETRFVWTGDRWLPQTATR